MLPRTSPARAQSCSDNGNAEDKGPSAAWRCQLWVEDVP